MIRVLLSLVLAAALLPASSGAAEVPTGRPDAGPVLAGSGVLWVVVTSPDGAAELRSAPVTGGQSSVLASFPTPFGHHGLEPALAASETRIALSNAAGDVDTPWGTRTVLTAPLGGSFETLDHDCNLFANVERPRVVDVSGELMIYISCGSEDRRWHVLVRDYSGATPVEREVPTAYPLGLRIAGRYLAWLDGGNGQAFVKAGIVVYDRLLDRVVYRIAKQTIPGELHDLDLQDDGKIAFSYGGPPMRVAWASPAAPNPHVLDLPPRDSYDVRIAGDWIGYEGGRSECCTIWSLADVGVTDLAGHARRIGNLGEGDLGSDNFDFDGQRLAWWSYGCRRAFIRVADTDGPPDIKPPRQGCPLLLTRPPTAAGRRVRVRVDCAGFPGDACDALGVKITRRHTIIATGRDSYHTTLSAAGRRLLRRHHPLNVRITATLHDDAGRREHRTTTTTLRRRAPH